MGGTGQATMTLAGHDWSIWCVAVFADGEHVITGSGDGLTDSGDGTAKIWTGPGLKRMPLQVCAEVAENGNLKIVCYNLGGEELGSIDDVQRTAQVADLTRCIQETIKAPTGGKWLLLGDDGENLEEENLVEKTCAQHFLKEAEEEEETSVIASTVVAATTSTIEDRQGTPSRWRCC